MMPPIILASASPQRAELLRGLGVKFSVIPSVFDEATCMEKDPATRSTELARWKAESVAQKNANAIVIGCDTLVVASDGTLLEKPTDETEARSMLRRHSGNVSMVHSGLHVIAPGQAANGLNSNRVTFAELSDETIDWWIGTGLWKDRSGGFQIDGPGQLLIAKLEGDWSGVVGLPVFLLGQLFAELGQSLT